jgi:hypothetical protein
MIKLKTLGNKNNRGIYSNSHNIKKIFNLLDIFSSDIVICNFQYIISIKEDENIPKPFINKNSDWF